VLVAQHGALVQEQDVAGNTALHCAVAAGSVAIVQCLLQHAVETKLALNAQNADKDTALHLTCAAGNMEIMALLTNANANTKLRNNNGETPLDISKHSEGLHEALSEHQTKVDNDETLDKLSSGCCPAVFMLGCGGVDPYVPTFSGLNGLQYALQKGNMCAAALMFPHYNLLAGSAPYKGSDQLMPFGCTVGILSCCRNMSCWCKNNRVDVNDARGISAGYTGLTALHLAAEQGLMPLAQQLVKQGANPAITDSGGRDAATVATAAGHSEGAAFLKGAEAEVNNPPSSVGSCSAESRTDAASNDGSTKSALHETRELPDEENTTSATAGGE
jgi:hypothetical protein